MPAAATILCHHTFQGMGMPGAVGATEIFPGSKVDLLTGIPWPANTPADTSTLGEWGAFPLKFARSEIVRLWWNVKKLRIDHPDGTAIADIRSVFKNRTDAILSPFDLNPFNHSRGVFAFPLANWQFIVQTGILFQLGFTSPTDFLSDGHGGYFPEFRYAVDLGGGESVNSCFLGEDQPAAGNVIFDDFNSDAVAELRATNPYGDVHVSIEEEWG